MKYLITTIAAILLIGCGSSPDHSGTYILSNSDKEPITLELKPDGSFSGMPKGKEDDRAIGSWKVEGELLICEGTTEKSSKQIVIKFNKTTKKLISISADGKEMPIEDEIPEGEDGLYLKKSVEPVDEAAKPEPPQAKAPDISIHDAAGDGNIEAVKQHLATGTDVNAKNENSQTPLHCAADKGHKEIVELLIAKSADLNPISYGMTPLDYAAHQANPNASAETADLLRKHGAKTAEELKAEGK